MGVRISFSADLHPPFLKTFDFIFLPFKIEPCSQIKGDSLAFVGDKDRVPIVVFNGKSLKTALDLRRVLYSLLEEEYIYLKNPILNFIPFHYHRIPGAIRFKVLKAMTAMKLLFSRRSISFLFYPNPAGEAILWAIKAIAKNDPNLPWTPPFSFPHPSIIPVSITFDVDTVEGVSALCKFLEKSPFARFPLTIFITAKALEQRNEEVREFLAQGYEIGLHGIDHRLDLSFMPLRSLRSLFHRYSHLFEPFSIKGFRAPFLLSSFSLLTILSDYFTYQSSTPDVDLALFSKNIRGCHFRFPYKRGEGIWEIPLTIPLDDRLLSLGFKEDEILDIWKRKVQWIASLKGVVVFTFHGERHFLYHPLLLKAREALFDWLLKKEDFKFFQMRELIGFSQQWSATV